MDVLIGVQRPQPYPLAQHVTSRRLTRQTTQGSTSITETFMEVIMDAWPDVNVDPSQQNIAARQVTASQTTQFDPMSEAFWAEASTPLSGMEVSRQVQHSSSRQFQDSRSQNVPSQRAPRRTEDQLSIMEMLTGVEPPQYPGQYRSVPALPESRAVPSYSPSTSIHSSLPSTGSSANRDPRLNLTQRTSSQNEPRSSQVTRSYQSVDPNLQTVMGASLRDDKSRFQNQNMPTYQPTRTTIQSYGSSQSDQPMQVPLESFLGSDSSQRRDRNRLAHQQFSPLDQIDLTGSTLEERLAISGPTIGDRARESTGRYQYEGTSQFNRPPPSYSFPSTPANISTSVESQYQGQHSSPTSTRSRTAREDMPTPMPLPPIFEMDSSTRVTSRNQGYVLPETYWPTTIKVEPQEQEEYQYASSQISPQIAPSGQYNPTVLPSLPTSMASVAQGMPQAQSQYIPEYPSSRVQPSYPNLSDPTNPFSAAQMDIFTGTDTSRYQGQFISAPLLTEHQTQQSNLPDPLTYPFLGATMDTSETQNTSQGDNDSSCPFSETKLIKMEPPNQSLLDPSLVIDLEDSSTEMPSYEDYNIPTPPLPEASHQPLHVDLPNLNAYPSLAAAIDALAEMEIDQQNPYESEQQSSQASMPVANDPDRFRVGMPQAQSQSQIFDPMSDQFSRASTSSSVEVQPLQRQSSNREIPSAPAQRPPETERQRVARLLREFLKNSSK